MTKSEEKLLELLMEKVERLESEVAKVKEGGPVIHNHYHSHYHGPRYSNPYWPYYGTTWNVSSADSGTYMSGSGSGSISSASGTSANYGLAESGRNSSKLGGSVNYNKLEDAAEYQVIALARA